MGTYGQQMWGLGYVSEDHEEALSDNDEATEGEEGEKKCKENTALIEKMFMK